MRQDGEGASGRRAAGTVDLWRPRWKFRGASALLLTGFAAAIALFFEVGRGQVRIVGPGGEMTRGRGLAPGVGGEGSVPCLVEVSG